jgi:hypothetical protein
MDNGQWTMDNGKWTIAMGKADILQPVDQWTRLISFSLWTNEETGEAIVSCRLIRLGEKEYD